MRRKKMLNFKMLNEMDPSGKVHVLELGEGPFSGVQFYYGGVSFAIDEANDRATMNFDYDVIRGTINPDHVETFENEIGEILASLIEEQNEKNTLVYHGGTDPVQMELDNNPD
jgi:hypothetical protein